MYLKSTLKIKINDSAYSLGQNAGNSAAEKIKSAISQNGFANIMDVVGQNYRENAVWTEFLNTNSQSILSKTESDRINRTQFLKSGLTFDIKKDRLLLNYDVNYGNSNSETEGFGLGFTTLDKGKSHNTRQDATITYQKRFDNKSQKLDFVPGERYAYSNNSSGTSENQLDDKYLLDIYSNQTLAASILNLSFKLNENHSISFKNIGSISSDNRLIHSVGSTGLSNNNPAINDITTRFFKSSTVYSGQLTGDHYMPKFKLKTNWVGSYGRTSRTIPNYRTTSYSHFEKPNDPDDHIQFTTM